MQLFHFFQEPLLSEPPVAPLTVDIGELWVRYPQAPDPWPIHHGHVFRAIARFRTIMNEAGNRSFGPGKSKGPMTLEEAMVFREKLVNWLQSLPSPLAPNNLALPTSLKLQCVLQSVFLPSFHCLTIV